MPDDSQRIGGFARSLLAGLGVAEENRFALRAAAETDGSPAATELESALDRLDLLRGAVTFNLHPHLPQFERLGGAANKLDVLVRQRIDLKAPSHPFTRSGRTTFNALLQSEPGIFAGNLFVGDVTSSRLPAASTVCANSGPRSWNARKLSKPRAWTGGPGAW